MKFVPLTRGHVAMVPDEHYQWLTEISWQAAPDGHTWYARSNTKIKGKNVSLSMHRMIAERAGMNIEGLQVDHYDGNGLNNTLGNLRVATISQNHMNRHRRPGRKRNVDLPNGVFKQGNRYKVCIAIKSKVVYRAYFSDKNEAIAARLAAEREHYGEWARPDIVELTGSEFASFTMPSGRAIVVV